MANAQQYPAAVSCDSNQLQAAIARGYKYLDNHDWTGAKLVGGGLGIISNDCDDPYQKLITYFQGVYIFAVAVHHDGDDKDARTLIRQALVNLELMKLSGKYPELYQKMQPRFAALQAEIH